MPTSTVVYTSDPAVVKGVKNQGVFAPGTTYALNDLVVFSGVSYFSLVAGNLGNTPSSSPTQWQILGGAQGPPISFKGAWSTSITYAVGDAVSFTDGASYISLQAGNIAHTPSSSSTFWAVLSAPGTPVFTATAPVADTLAGAAGVATTSARSDHAHPFPTAMTGVSGNFAIGGNVTSSQFLALASPNALNLAFAVTDAVGSVALGVDASTGEIVGPTLLPADAVVSGSSVTLVGDISTATFQQLELPNSLNAVFAVADASGSVAFGIDENGNIIGGSQGLNAVQDADGTTFFTAIVSGKTQIFRLERGSVTPLQLTSLGDNTFPALSLDGTAISFMSDRSGTIAPYQMDTVGNNQLPAGSTIINTTDVFLMGSHGQSTSRGTHGNPPLSTAQPFSNLMLQPTGAATDGNSGPVDNNATGFTGLIPLVETAFDSFTNAVVETHASGLANQLTNLQLNNHAASFQSVQMLVGQGGTPLANLTLASLANVMTSAISFLPGKRCVCPGVAFLHGEADETAQNLNYGTALVAFRDQVQILIQAATAQTQNTPFFLMQLASSYVGGAPSVIAPQQLAVSKLWPNKFVMCGPRYQYAYFGDQVHFTNTAYRQQGELIAKVMWRTFYGFKWRPLSFRSVVRIGAVIYVRFWVPVAPIVIDTTLVAATTIPGGMNGFELVTPDSVTITGVAIVAPDTAKLTLSAASVAAVGAATLYYARTPNASSHATGNIRDSDVTPSFYGYNSFNWAVCDSLTC